MSYIMTRCPVVVDHEPVVENCANMEGIGMRREGSKLPPTREPSCFSCIYSFALGDRRIEDRILFCPFRNLLYLMGLRPALPTMTCRGGGKDSNSVVSEVRD